MLYACELISSSRASDFGKLEILKFVNQIQSARVSFSTKKMRLMCWCSNIQP